MEFNARAKYTFYKKTCRFTIKKRQSVNVYFICKTTEYSIGKEWKNQKN